MSEEPIRQIIVEEELTLRPYCEKTDKNIFYKMFKNDEFFDWFYPYSKKDFKHLCLEGKHDMFEFGFVIERNKDKAIIGCIICDNCYSTSHHVLQISYYVGKEYRNQGYMQKALRTLINCGFKGKLIQYNDISFKNRKYVIQAFKATVDLDNDASSHLLEKLGFTYTGIEYCAFAYDSKVVKDRKHYYLENPNHPPKRKGEK